MNTQHQWIGVTAVHAKLGGAIGIHEVRRLMRENHIKSWWVRGKLVTSVANCDEWMRKIENSAHAGSHAGVPYIVPIAFLHEKAHIK
jgi:hypothetical protein